MQHLALVPLYTSFFLLTLDQRRRQRPRETTDVTVCYGTSAMPTRAVHTVYTSGRHGITAVYSASNLERPLFMFENGC